MFRVTRFVLGLFVPFLAGSLMFFVLIVQMVDFFSRLLDLMNNRVGLELMLQIQVLYLPGSLVMALPIASVFASSYTMGNLQIHNELLALHATGSSLFRVIASMVTAVFLLGLGGFVVQEFLSIPMMKERELLLDKALNRPAPLSNADVHIYDKKNSLVFHAQYYNHDLKEIQDLTIVERNATGALLAITHARRAQWKDGLWHLSLVDQSAFESDRRTTFQSLPELVDERFTLKPESFMGSPGAFETLNLDEAWNYLNTRRDTGLSYREEETKYQGRFAFMLTPLVVSLLAMSAGRRFKKHVVLLSLLVSLGLAVLYYVLQLVSNLMASLGLLPPLVGAWASVIVLLSASVFLLFQSQRV